MRRILEKLGHTQLGSITMYCDNSSTIKLDVRFHLRDLTKDGTLELVHCSSQNQIADIMTKPLKFEAFEMLRGLLGMCFMSDIN